jgi:hypothetical protein
MKRLLSFVLAALLAGIVHPATAQETQPAGVLQALLDAAAPGDVVDAPAGVYEGTLRLPDYVMLRGEGDDLTVIDAGGAPEAVIFGKESALVGFTVRNGQVLAASKGNFIGIFECTFEAFERIGVLFDAGSGVMAHNVMAGGPRTVGIAAHNANPLVMNNVIRDNRIGFQLFHGLIPSLVNNLFVSNQVAIHLADGSNAVIMRNLFDGNRTPYNRGELPDGNEVRAVSPEEMVLVRGGLSETYRDLMDETYTAAVKDHPIILYDLHDEPGFFDAITLFPWATFTVNASAADTVIDTFRAYDWVGERALRAEYVVQADQRPGVKVDNPELVEKMRERYVLENLYVHPASYFEDEAGRRVFRRMTNLGRIEVAIPHGYQVVSVKPLGAPVPGGDGAREVIAIEDIGVTHVEVVMERVPARR